METSCKNCNKFDCCPKLEMIENHVLGISEVMRPATKCKNAEEWNELAKKFYNFINPTVAEDCTEEWNEFAKKFYNFINPTVAEDCTEYVEVSVDN